VFVNYLLEIKQWEARAAQWCGPDARLVYVSSQSSDIRVYRHGNRVFKVRRLTPASVHDRPNSLEDEHAILLVLATRQISGVLIPTPISYQRDGEWECLELVAIEPPLTSDPVSHPMRETLRGVGRLVRSVWRLNQAGVSHGDLVPGNAGDNAAGTMVLLDFDQAAFAHPLRSMWRDFLGLPAGGRAARYSVLDRFGRHPWFAPAFRAARAIRCLCGGGRSPDDGPWGMIGRCRARGDEALVALAEAWTTAAQSGANSPGRGVAYYSLDDDGIHLPGERPWIMRWHAIARTVDFRGKRLVELGCNMGLLSIHAQLTGATSAVGADINEDVVRAARMAATIFGVNAQFLIVDFDNHADWEEQLGGGDIASALSLTNWLHDKDRLWRYLGRFREVLFEGHERDEDTRARLAGLGFDRIAEVGLSERQRMVFHASKKRDQPGI